MALQAGNFTSARKHAAQALSAAPWNPKNWLIWTRTVVALEINRGTSS
jgi:hypothetical protein